MLGINRKAARYTWTVVVVLLLLAMVYTIRSTLFVFVVALLFAYLLSPLVNLLDRALPAKRTRGLALALAYVIFIGVAVTVAIKIGSTVVDQAQALTKKFPDMLAKWETPSDKASDNLNDLKAQIIENLRKEIGQRTNDLVHALPAAGMKLVELASNLIFVVIIPVLAFFFLKDGEEIRLHILALVDAGPWRKRVDSLLEDVHLLLLDMHMPRLTGLQLQVELKNRNIELGVIAISARDDADTRHMALQLGARFFFRKPVDDQALLDTIQWVLTSASEPRKPD